MEVIKKKEGRFKEIAITVIVALLGGVGYLVYNNSTQSKDIEMKDAKVTEMEKAQAELEKEYYTALADLEGLKGTNQEMNTLIENQKLELKKQKDQISGLITVKGDLNNARTQIKKLKASADSYMAEINKLKAENEELGTTNTTLTKSNEELQVSVQNERMAKDELANSKAALTEEKRIVDEERTRLAKKVNYASVIRVDDISVKTLNVKDSGKEVKKSSADQVERLKVCFKASKNDVAEAGSEQFFIRVINPVGETVSSPGLGSGILVNNTNNEQLAYTLMKEVDYSNEAMDACLTWDTNSMNLSKGTYEIEVYNKGYIVGKSTFKLK